MKERNSKNEMKNKSVRKKLKKRKWECQKENEKEKMRMSKRKWRRKKMKKKEWEWKKENEEEKSNNLSSLACHALIFSFKIVSIWLMTWVSQKLKNAWVMIDTYFSNLKESYVS